MWFEVNVRLSAVTDLKWPHGTEWQCANSTLAMSWPNHVQILSFTSMASHQGAVKHGFVRKMVGGCSTYDVIAPWPDLTWSIFLPKVAQGFPHKVPKNPAALRSTVFSLSANNLRGEVAPPSLSGRGLSCFRYLCFQLIFGPLLFTCEVAFMGAERGTGNASSPPPVDKLVGQVSPRNEDISDTFFLTHFKCNIFQYVQNRVAEIRGKNIFGVGGFGCLWIWIHNYSKIVHLW